MTKTQKIWLGISLAAFIIPEVLLGTVLGLVSLNRAFAYDSSNHAILTVITLIQFIGLVLSAILVFRLHTTKYYLKAFVGTALLLLSFWCFYIFYLLYSTVNFLK
jgi:hypothetical protein